LRISLSCSQYRLGHRLFCRSGSQDNLLAAESDKHIQEAVWDKGYCKHDAKLVFTDGLRTYTSRNRKRHPMTAMAYNLGCLMRSRFGIGLARALQAVRLPTDYILPCLP